MVESFRTGAMYLSMIYKEMKKKQVPLTPAELAAEKAAWKEQELKVDHADRIIK
jgi:hypothetical protein|tara:strand:+ start:304 stop:465 length:162 start_codon:yes stop_codon:yes gene_type:complete